MQKRAGIAALLAFMSPAFAQPAEDFFKGKQLSLQIGRAHV
mgnify:CR=1 FL=1